MNEVTVSAGYVRGEFIQKPGCQADKGMTPMVERRTGKKDQQWRSGGSGRGHVLRGGQRGR